MALPTSGSLSLTQIIAQFGGPSNLAAYYRGGSYVKNTSANQNISTSASGLAISQFYGASAYVNVSAYISPNPGSGSGSGTQGSGAITSGALTCYPSGGSGSYTYSWSITGVYSLSSQTVSSPSAQSTTFYAVSSGGGYLTVQCVCSDGTTSSTPTATVNYTWTQVAQCVAEDCFLFDGRQAKDFEIGDEVRSTNPYSYQTQMRKIRMIFTSEAECYRVVTSSGASLTVSETAPFPVLGSDKYVTTLEVQGHYIPVTRDVGSDQPLFIYEQVVDVIPVGIRRIRPLDINDNCFWASDDGKSFILKSNKTLIP
jgi:hypothetical protein